MPASDGDRSRDTSDIIDRLIYLLAEIEVARYLREAEQTQTREGLEDEDSNLRPL